MQYTGLLHLCAGVQVHATKCNGRFEEEKTPPLRFGRKKKKIEMSLLTKPRIWICFEKQYINQIHLPCATMVMGWSA